MANRGNGWPSIGSSLTVSFGEQQPFQAIGRQVVWDSAPLTLFNQQQKNQGKKVLWLMHDWLGSSNNTFDCLGVMSKIRSRTSCRSLDAGVVIGQRAKLYCGLPRHTRLRGIQEGLAEVVAEHKADLHCAPHVQTEFFQSPKFSLFIISDRSKPSMH